MTLEKSIVSNFGMCLTLTDVAIVLGVKKHDTARKWVREEKLEAVEINGRRRWLAADIAKALERSKIRAAVLSGVKS